MKTLTRTSNASVVWLFSLLIFCDTFSQVLFKMASLEVGAASLESWQSFLAFAGSLLLQPALVGGVMLLLVAFCCWMLLMSRTDLSKAHLISGIAYATVPLVSVYLFAEHLSPSQIMGIGLITLGATISSLS